MKKYLATRVGLILAATAFLLCTVMFVIFAIIMSIREPSETGRHMATLVRGFGGVLMLLGAGVFHPLEKQLADYEIG